MLSIDTQRFIQIFLNERIMSDDDVCRQVTTIFGEKCLEKQIKIINTKLKKYNLIIKSTICELTGQKYWICTSDSIDKIMNYRADFTDIQLEFIRKIFREIINSDDGHISSIACINICSQIDNLGPLQAEAFLDLLVKQKWLSMKEGRVYMGVRSIGELIPYFKQSYVDEIHICPSCTNGVFYGYRCENCQVLIHFYCLAKMKKIQKNLKCMNCQMNIVIEKLSQVVGEISINFDGMDDDILVLDDTHTF